MSFIPPRNFPTKPHESSILTCALTICQTEHLVVIDTVKAKDTPGSIYRFHPDAIPIHLSYNVSAHEVEFMDLLLKAEMMGEAPETTFITVVPEDILGDQGDAGWTVQKDVVVLLRQGLE